MDAEQGRDGRFNRYKDTPNGFVLDYLRFAGLFGEGENYFDLQAVDAAQDDERYQIRLGLGDKLRLRYAFSATPMVFGNQARLLLGQVGPGSSASATSSSRDWRIRTATAYRSTPSPREREATTRWCRGSSTIS